MRRLPKGSFFTDIYGLKFCVHVLHWDLQSSGMLHSVLLVSYRRFGTNYRSHRRSHFIVDYIFPAKPVPILMENHHYSKYTVGLQWRKRQLITDVHKMCRSLVFWVLWMCVLPRALPREVPFDPGHKKKYKSQLNVWKIIYVWSNEAYCRQQLLKVQVKRSTYQWGMKWNSMVNQVKNVTFQRMGSVCIAHPQTKKTLW